MPAMPRGGHSTSRLRVSDHGATLEFADRLRPVGPAVAKGGSWEMLRELSLCWDWIGFWACLIVSRVLRAVAVSFGYVCCFKSMEASLGRDCS